MTYVVPDTSESAIIEFLDGSEQWRAVVAWLVDTDETGSSTPKLTPLIPGGLPEVYALRDKWGYYFPNSSKRFSLTELEEALSHGREEEIQTPVEIDEDDVAELTASPAPKPRRRR